MILKVKYRLKQKLIDRILKLKDIVAPETAETFVTHSRKDVESDAEIRRTEIRWLMPDRFPFVHDELTAIVREHQLQLGISTALYIEKGVQLATYRPGDHYSWHEDGHPQTPRGAATETRRRHRPVQLLGNASGRGYHQWRARFAGCLVQDPLVKPIP